MSDARWPTSFTTAKTTANSFESKRAGRATFPKHVKISPPRPQNRSKQAVEARDNAAVFALIFLNFDFQPHSFLGPRRRILRRIGARTSHDHNETFQRHRSSHAGAGRRHRSFVDGGCPNAACCRWPSTRHVRGLPSGRDDHITPNEGMSHGR